MKEIDKITVHLNDDLVGTIQQDPSANQCVFEYAGSWLKNGFSISPWELPLKPGLIFSKPDTFYGNFAAFEDSMPDGYGLYLIDRILRKRGLILKSLSPLQRLAIVGNAGMGALKYGPSVMGSSGESLNVYSDFDSFQSMALDVLSEKDLDAADLLYYNSNNAGGARPKATFIAEDDSSWIIKFRHTFDPVAIGRIEYEYMSAASECGISVPQFCLVNDKYFAIRRFDISEGRRIHVLTAAALLQSDIRMPDVDYTNLLAMTGYLTQDHLQVEEMFRRMVFNIVADNKDDHAKNFSFTCRNGQWALAPAYDLTWSPEGIRGEHTTSVMFKGNPGLSDVMAAGRGIRIPEKKCREIIEQVCDVCSLRLKYFKPLQ